MNSELFNLAYSIQMGIDEDRAHKKSDPVGYFNKTYPVMLMDNIKRAYCEANSAQQFRSLIKQYCKLTKSGIDSCEVCQHYLTMFKSK